MSTLDTCVTQPACGAAISSEVAPAVTAPTGAGWGASTLSTTTATGTTSTYVKAVAAIAVVTGGVLTPESTTNDANIARWHYWSQATNSRAQEIARQRYCAAYPNVQVCNYTKIFYVQGYGYRAGCLPPVFVSIQIPFGQEGNIISQADSYCGRGGVLAYYRNGGRFNDTIFAGGFSIFSTSNPPIPWKDWSQEKRSIAVAALTDSDWQGLITSMPEGGRLNPGDTVSAPTIVIPGEETDDPITPQDDRLPRKERGFFTNPGSPNTDYDHDGTPDTSDPEPQNPNVPRASSNPPEPTPEPSPEPPPNPSEEPGEGQTSPTQPSDATPDSSEIDPNDQYLDDRAKEIAQLMDSFAQSRRTIAVARVRNSDGTEEQVVASSNGYLTPTQQNATDQAGETRLPNDRVSKHAQQKIIEWAEANGKTVEAIGTSRNICSSCWAEMQSRNIRRASGLQSP